MRRWVLNFGKFSIRLHHWYTSDDARYLHDHPWWFLTFVFKGGYKDVHDGRPEEWGPGDAFVPRVTDVVKAPAIRYRPALHRHTVQVNPGGAWTIMITGPEVRRWGFWVKGKFKTSWRYFFDHGHHQCEP